MKLGIILACIVCAVVIMTAMRAVAFIAKRMEDFADMFNVDYADEPDNATKA